MKFFQILFFCIAYLIGFNSLAQAESLVGNELRETVSGKTVYLSVALGVELPIKYRSGGVMTGKLSSFVKLVKSDEPLNDSGKWWIKGDQLCQRWSQWLDGQSYCYRLKKTGEGVVWQRNDGKSGTARITQ